MDRGRAAAAEVLDDGLSLDEDARRAVSIDVDVEILDAMESRLDAARTSLSTSCGIPLTRREGAGFIRYGDGGFYGPHRDRGYDPQWPDAARRRLAVVVFLNNEGFTGGELVIYRCTSDDRSDPIRVTPRQGWLVAFDAALLHEVRRVSGGVRDVVVDWFY